MVKDKQACILPNLNQKLEEYCLFYFLRKNGRFLKVNTLRAHDIETTLLLLVFPHFL